MLSDSGYLTHPFLDALVISHRKALTIDGLPNSSYQYPSQQLQQQQQQAVITNSIDHNSDSDSSHHNNNDAASVSPAVAFLSAFSSPQSRTSLPDAEGAIVGGYTLGPVVGHGGFSTIRRAFSNSGGTVAVKIVLRADLAKQGNPTLARKRLDYESAIWASLSHEHVLPLFSAVHTPYADYFFTLLCPSGSLFDIIKSNGHPTLPLEDLGVVFSQVVRGLRYLHEVAGVVHRDIKLENVLVDEMGVCRIADFGMARKIGEFDSEDQVCPQGSSSSSAPRVASAAAARHRNSAPLPSSNSSNHPTHIFQPGSLPYASPELLLPPTSSPLAPHPAQDIWALGVLLYVMLTGRLPFHDSFDPRLQKKILRGVYDMPPEIGRTTARVLQGCLERSVPSRWTIDMVDEMAWDIGSCVDDDDAPTEAHNDFPVHPPTRQRSPSLSRHEQITPSSPPPPEASGKPSLETARRRSTSRVERSLSRAPVPAARSTSSGRRRSSSSGCRNGVSIPQPRLPHTAPPVTALNTAILGGASVFSDSPTVHFESDLGYSPAFLDRGRRLEHPPASRSPSPSVLPATPEDTDQQHFVLPAGEDDLSAQRYLLERGRSSNRREHSGRTSPLYGTADSGTHVDGELDVLSETTRWAQNAGQPILSCIAPMPVFSTRSAQQGEKSRRAGSTPPAPSSTSSSWSMSSKPTWAKERTGLIPSVRRRTSNADSPPSPSSAKPIPIPTNNGSRSRSLGEWQRF